MNNKRWVILLMAGNSFLVHANNPFNDYLLAAQTDVYNIELGNTSIPEMNIAGSWFEDAQFRVNSTTPTNNVDIKKNYLSYEVRVKPKAWGQRGVEEDIIMLRKKQYENSSQQLLSFALQDRYLKLLDYVDKQSANKYLLELSDALMQEKKLIKSQVRSAQFNPKKLLGIDDQLKQTQDRVKLNLTQLKIIQTQLGLSLDSAQFNSDLTWVVSVPEMQSNTSVGHDENQSSLAVLNARLQFQLSQSQSQLIKTKQQLGVNLLKFEYGDQEHDEMAFQIGVNIPLGTRFSEMENQYKLHVAKAELNTSLLKMKQSLNEMSKEITWLSGEFSAKKNQIERARRYMQKDYVKTDSLLMIDLYKKVINYKQKKETINQRILSLYIRYLALSGKLTQQPLRNWIQKGTPELLSNRTY